MATEEEMSPEEKALIDARRAGFLACWSSEFGPLTDDAYAAAVLAFPYPPEPEEYVDEDGRRWRFRDGRVEEYTPVGKWLSYRWLTPAFIRGLYSLLPETAEEEAR